MAGDVGSVLPGIGGGGGGHRRVYRHSRWTFYDAGLYVVFFCFYFDLLISNFFSFSFLF